MKPIRDWGEALNGAINGEITPEEAAKWAVENRVDIEYYEPNERTYKMYGQIMTAYNEIKSHTPRRQSNVHVINGTETPGYQAHENVDDGPTGLGL